MWLHFRRGSIIMLNNISEISDYNKKAEFLRVRGWEDMWHPDNWIKNEWRDNPRYNIDMAGLSMERALKVEKYEAT